MSNPQEPGEAVPLNVANFLVKQSELSSEEEDDEDWTSNGGVPFSRYNETGDQRNKGQLGNHGQAGGEICSINV